MINIPKNTNIIKLNFKFKSFHAYGFNLILPKILKKIHGEGLKSSGFVSLPTKLHRFTVLRSPHVDKKSREQFEIKCYSKAIQIFFDPQNEIQKQKAKLLINFIKNSASGLNLKISYIV
jgi:small subunit ribosomal protein S10